MNIFKILSSFVFFAFFSTNANAIFDITNASESVQDFKDSVYIAVMLAVIFILLVMGGHIIIAFIKRTTGANDALTDTVSMAEFKQAVEAEHLYDTLENAELVERTVGTTQVQHKLTFAVTDMGLICVSDTFYGQEYDEIQNQLLEEEFLGRKTASYRDLR